MPLGRLTSYTVKPGARAEFLAAMAEHNAHVTAAEPGTLIFLVHSDRDHAETMWLYGVFADEAARALHDASGAAAATTGKLAAIVDETKVLDLDILRSKGLDAETRA